MSMVISETAGDDFPTFAGFVASRLPVHFLKAVRPLVASSYEQAYSAPMEGDPNLPYRRNLQPHDRNRRVFEELHSLASELGMAAEAKCLDNGYHYLEVESNGLTLHVKHRNNYQTIKEQMVKADYRRQMTTINAPFGQIPLFRDEQPTAVPPEAYMILFFSDSDQSKEEAGSIFFMMPSNEVGNILASCEIEEAIAHATTDTAIESPPATDDIDLPSKRDEDQAKDAQ